MRRLLAVALAAIICLAAGTQAFAQKKLVSGKLKKLNDRAVIAVDPLDGNALIVWSQGNAADNDFGRIYAAYLTRNAGGGYAIGDPFLVSPNSGSHQRPSIAWLPAPGLFIIAWDTAYRDLNEYMDFDHIADRPLPGATVLARTWNPATAELGDIVTVNHADWELSVGAHVILIDQAQASPSASTERVLITFLSSDEERNGVPGPFEPGLWGSLWTVGVQTSPGRYRGFAEGGNIALVQRKSMLTWAVEYGVAATVSAFVSGGKVYAAGAYMKFNFPMGNFYASGVGGIYKIDPTGLAVEKFVKTGELDLGPGKPFPLNIHGQVMPLPGSPFAPNGDFNFACLSNVDKRVMSQGSDLVAGNRTYYGYAAKKGTEIVDQRIFGVSDSGASSSSVADTLYVLYYDKKGRFRHRKLTEDGKPTGVIKTDLKIRKNRLQYMDVANYGNEALVVISEMRNKKKYQIYFFTFTAK